MHILILDADPLVLTTLTETVRRRLPGVVVHAATSFQAGLKKLTVRVYDALLIDAELPETSGAGSLSLLRLRYPDTPVVLMTAQLNQALLASATLSGVYYYLHKPIEQNVLMSVLNRVMEYTRFGQQIDHLTIKADRHTKRARKAIAYSRLLLEAKESVLRRRQQSLEHSEDRSARLANIIDGAPFGLVALDRSWRIVWLNQAVPQYFRTSQREDVLGRLFWTHYPEMVGSVFERECRRVVEQQIAVKFLSRFPSDDQWYEIHAASQIDGLSLLFREAIKSDSTGQEHPRPDHSDQHPLLKPPADSQPVQVQSETLRITSNRSIEDRGPDASWRHLSEHLQSAREAERARIARDLRDDLGQFLGALKMDLAWLDARLAPQQIPALLKVRFMAHLVNRMGDALQRICSELRPAILDDLGLAAAMQWQASTFEHRTGLRCIVSVKGLDRLDTERSTGLFRVFQELLAYAPLHPRATVVWVTVKEEGTGLIMEVRDNGPETQERDLTEKNQHFLNLNERVLLLGGTLSLNRPSGQSTSILITIPLLNRPPS